MKRLGALTLFVVMLAFVPAETQAPADTPSSAYAYPPAGWYYGSPEFIDRIGEVLGAVNSPERRSKLAEDWLNFSKQTIARSLEAQDEWLGLQRQQLRQQQQTERLHLEIYRLQKEIEQLRAENLRLQQENLQRRQELEQPTYGRSPNGPPAAVVAPR